MSSKKSSLWLKNKYYIFITSINTSCLSVTNRYIFLITSPVCELVYKPEARVEWTTGQSIRILYKKMDLNFGVKI